MNNNLTPKQNKVYLFIARRIDSLGFPPTIREMAEHFSCNIGTIQAYLRALEKKGAIKKLKEQARGIMIVGKKLKDQFRIPILGRVVAGVPLEAISDTEDYLSVDESIAKQANFALRVRGDSMAPEFHEGDLVLVKHTPQADNGDVVIALLEDEGAATVKRLRKKGKEMILEATNPRYAPIVGRPFTVIGKVTSLIRTFY